MKLLYKKSVVVVVVFVKTDDPGAIFFGAQAVTLSTALGLCDIFEIS